jgi:hypothetical protein
VRAELVAAGYSFVDRLPELQATVPIATIDQLETWQGYYDILKAMVWLGPLLVVVLLSTGVWLLRDAALSGLWFAGSAFLALIAVTVGVRAAVGSVTAGIADPLAADAARAIIDTLTNTLVRNATAVGVLLVIALAACAYVAARRRLEPPTAT